MAASTEELLVVFCTFPTTEAAGETAHALIAERLCACVNVLPAMRSIYPWKGEIANNGEVLTIIKTTRARYPALEARIRELHSYDVPEIVAVPASHVSESYRQWVEEETS